MYNMNMKIFTLLPQMWGVRAGLPCCTVDENLPANSGDMGSIPDPGEFHMSWSNWAHVPHLLSPHAAMHPGTCAPIQEKSLQWEVHISQVESGPALCN